MVGATRIELATSRPPDVRTTTVLCPETLNSIHNYYAHSKILYMIFDLAFLAGFEPATLTLEG